MANKTNIPFFAASMIALVAVGCSTTPAALKPVGLDFKELRVGDILIQERRTVVIRNANEQASLWKEGMWSGGGTMPNIDFSRYMLVGVFLGVYPVVERPELSFSGVKRHFDPDRIEVTYKIRDYKPVFGNVTLPSAGSLHKLALVPRSNLPVQFVELKEE
ncbi:hypothetical protein [Noviherbaspirillum sp. Root189]|uniref:hypothetical protein n=1 Tax=Noviherbaspirillum sp. Root189 TaxID=1736487 RepID=UPI00071402AE|nr:hypothetical protein [Noviherbaspirillum sp. Root189]KRB83467.1 hypothetical protein ASE07_23675 [Noviherbaspirillum sp. Root189]